MKILYNYIFLITFLMFNIIIISFFLLIKYNQLKNNEINKINLLFLELESEKKVSKKLIKKTAIINKIKNNTQLKLNKIKVSILNFDFSLSEVFK